jgi:hypothetical protein
MSTRAASQASLLEDGAATLQADSPDERAEHLTLKALILIEADQNEVRT